MDFKLTNTLQRGDLLNNFLIHFQQLVTMSFWSLLNIEEQFFIHMAPIIKSQQYKCVTKVDECCFSSFTVDFEESFPRWRSLHMTRSESQITLCETVYFGKT